MNGHVIGIDASRNRSGGAKAHLVGILTGCSPQQFGVEKVHLWAYRELADAIPDFAWLSKHSPDVLKKSLLQQVLWQFRVLPKEIEQYGCDLIFNTDAGSVCTHRPSVTMSQDMLSFEPGEMKRYFFSKAWIRLLLLRYVQAWSLRRANHALFLTHHASKVIQSVIGPVRQQTIINHGIGEEFRGLVASHSSMSTETPIKIVYISNAAFYKHQWHVVKAVAALRKSCHREVSLLLVGGGSGRPQQLLEEAIAEFDPNLEFVEQREYIPHDQIPKQLASSDIFVFASSCENMPITLLEGMASGLPIACSNRGPMPEVLEDGGVYFDPEDPDSVHKALSSLIGDPSMRRLKASRAFELAQHYTWERCASETWHCLSTVASNSSNPESDDSARVAS